MDNILDLKLGQAAFFYLVQSWLFLCLVKYIRQLSNFSPLAYNNMEEISRKSHT